MKPSMVPTKGQASMAAFPELLQNHCLVAGANHITRRPCVSLVGTALVWHTVPDIV